MIIDKILDRQGNDALLAQGYTHSKWFDGSIRPLAYSPEAFYREILPYGEIGDDITRAMDSGTENDVKQALCNYITDQGYNPDIIDYIQSRTWLTA